MSWRAVVYLFVVVIWTFGFGWFACGTLLYSVIGWWMVIPDLLASMAFGWFVLVRTLP